MDDDVSRLRRRFYGGRRNLFPAEARTSPCRELMTGYTALVDELVGEIYKASCRFADGEAGRTPHSGLAIVATGGYGRRELSPFSDVDIAFIPGEEQDRWADAAVHKAFNLVMDVFLSLREVRVGYAYRPLSEVSTWDLPTRVALLDARRLSGDPELLEKLRECLYQNLSPLDLVLEFQMEEKRSRGIQGPTMYSVEPQIKFGPGSLRDLHRGRWIYKLLLRADDASLMGALTDRGWLPPERLAEIDSAAEWLWRTRNWLHLVAGRRMDVLINNYQDRIARELDRVSAQEWLSRHYGHAEAVALFRDSAIRRAMEGPVDLGGVSLENGYLRRSRGGEEGEPAGAVKMFHMAQRYSVPISGAEIQELENSRAQALEVRDPSAEETWSMRKILEEGHDVARTIRALGRYGLMDRFVDSFEAMMRYAPPDPAHSFTIGDHSLKVIELLEDLRSGRDSANQRFSELLAQCPHFDVLCLAALVHDAGKLLPIADHTETGLGYAKSAAERLGLPPEKQDLLEFLVQRHLLLVRTGRLQDLKSPTVIQGVAEKCGSVDRMRHLYVFTFVDTRAVAERNWTSMDYRDLEELFRKAQSHLLGLSLEEEGRTVEARIGEIRHSIVRYNQDQDEEAVRRHCEAMPAGYILNIPLDEIAFHIKLLSRLEEEKVVLDIYNRPGDDFSELTVCAYDDPQPGLLAKIAGVLYGCNADIQKAQVFTMKTERPIVLDMLWIRSEGMQVSQTRANRITTALREILTGGRTVEHFLRGMGKHPPAGIPLDQVDLRNDLSDEETVVHVVARDLQGLLYLMTRAISGCGLHIHSARVATWAGRAENNFYVTVLTGGQIPDTELGQWKETLARRFQSG